MRNFKQYVVDIKSLHENIKEGNLDGIYKFLNKYPGEAHVFYQQTSAAATALKNENFEVYELLLSKGITLGPNEDILKILSSIRQETYDGEPLMKRRKLKELHMKYFKYPSLKHIDILRSKCRLSHTCRDRDRGRFNEIILQTFEDLNSIEYLEPMLKLVASSEFLRIVFDFDHHSVEQLDPTKQGNIRGTAYNLEGTVFIGARGLLDKEKCFEVYGTLAHELCHFAMQLLYNNRCKPYHRNDDGKQKLFREIFALLEQKKSLDEIVSLAFKYPFDKQHAELIVRIPHILAQYIKQDKKLVECQLMLSPLFAFFEHYVLNDMRDLYPLMEAKRELKDLNELCGVLCALEYSEVTLTCNSIQNLDLVLDATDRILNITSNYVPITMSAIYTLLKLEDNFLFSYIFIKFDDLEKDKIRELIIAAFKLNTKPTIIIDCDGKKIIEVHKMAEKLIERKLTERLIFITNELLKLQSVFGCFVTHSWSQLSDKSQKKLMFNQVKLQGKSLKLKDVLDSSSDAIYSVSLKDLMEEKVEIGKEIKFEVKFHFERKFIFHSKRGSFLHIIGISSKLEHPAVSGKSKPREISYDGIIDIAEQEKLLLLTDPPGNGKTVEFKTLALKLKEKFPSRWIIYWDLKNFVNFYDKDGQTSETLHKPVCEFLSQKILKLNSFDENVFTELFKSDRVVLLMDGFDEISPSYKQFIMNVLKLINHTTKNQIWISTRPHLVEALQNFIGFEEAYRLKPLTLDDEQTFLKLYFQHQNVDCEKNLEAVNKVFNLIKQRGTYLSNPFLLQMIAEIIADDENFQFNKPNYYSIYEAFVDKQIMRFMKKGREADKDSLNYLKSAIDIAGFHQKQAFKTKIPIPIELRSSYACWRPKMDSQALLNACSKATSSLTLEQIARIGLMYHQDSVGFTFVHRTFAEFFIADFIFKTIFKKGENFQSSDEMQEIAMELFLLEITDHSQNSKMTLIFLDNALDSIKIDENSERIKQIQEYLHKINEDNKCPNFLNFVSRTNSINFFKIFSLNLLDDKEKMHQIWLKRFPSNVLISVALFSSLDFIKQIWPLILEMFDHEQILELFKNTCEPEKDLIYFAQLNHDPQVFEFFKVKAKLVFGEDYNYAESCSVSATMRDAERLRLYNKVYYLNVTNGFVPGQTLYV